MRRLFPLVLLLLACILASCVSRAASPAGTYAVSADGTVSPVVRSASDAAPGVAGPQELFGIALPFGPFVAKGALLWDGQPWFWTPPAPAPQAARAAPCAPQTIEVEESYTEMVPVQRTRRVQRQVVPLPVPQAAPGCGPPAEPAACAGGRCEVPARLVAVGK